jgi:hypothetical protein
VVAADRADALRERLHEAGETGARPIGRVVAGSGDVRYVD